MYAFTISYCTFSHQLFRKATGISAEGSIYIETNHPVYYYTPLKADDFIRHKRESGDIDFEVSNSTLQIIINV
jgi:hypothetical protein